MHTESAPSPRKFRRLLMFSAALAAGPMFSGCAEKAEQKVPPPPLVGVAEARRMDVPVIQSPNGTVIALEQVTLRARVRGFVTERRFDEGASVRKGDLLFVIDEEPYRVALESAKARQAVAEAAVRKAEQSKIRETSEAKLSLDLAQLNLKKIVERRARVLLNRNAGSQEEFDIAEADRKQFEAQVAADQAAYDQAMADYDSDILAANAQLSDAKAIVRNAELDLGYCRMTSPIDGRIGQAIVKVGNLVGPGQEGGSFTELATIQQLDPIAVSIPISSRYLGELTRLVQEQTPVELVRPGAEGDERHPYKGQFYFIDNFIDETTSTFISKARMPNPRMTLLPGEYVKVSFQVEELKDVVVVPAQAVIETDSGPVVYVTDKEGKVAIQSVKAGLTVYQGMRVLFDGLEAGVPVIVEGLQLIRPGMPVKTQPATLARPVETPTTAGAAAEKAGSAAEKAGSAAEKAGPAAGQ